MTSAHEESDSLRILLVDDNIDHAKLAARALKSEPSWTVDMVRLGEEALQRFSDAPYDLVLLDYRLPDMTGLAVLDRLRAKHADAQVILMTSQGSEEVAMQALDKGATAYVVKTPGFGERLAYEVREWLQARAGA